MRLPFAAMSMALVFAPPVLAAPAQVPPQPGSPAKPAASVPAPPVAAPVRAMVAQPCTAASQSAYNSREDWAWLCRYSAANAAIDRARLPIAVFMGDSITQFWGERDPAYFSGRYADRGISGQTSPQMLVRFMADVVALHPRVVHIMAGTNDIAGNTGPNSPEDFKNNVRAMVALAKANGIAVVIGSILPTDHFDWQPTLRPAAQVAELNGWLKDFAKTEKVTYADYYAALAGPGGSLPAAYSKDGVHPEAPGYKVMDPIAEKAIAAALAGAARR